MKKKLAPERGNKRAAKWCKGVSNTGSEKAAAKECVVYKRERERGCFLGQIAASSCLFRSMFKTKLNTRTSMHLRFGRVQLRSNVIIKATVRHEWWP